MSNLIHIALATAPSGGTAYIGMRHVPEYRENITGYEIINTSSGMACDACGELVTDCK